MWNTRFFWAFTIPFNQWKEGVVSAPKSSIVLFDLAYVTQKWKIGPCLPALKCPSQCWWAILRPEDRADKIHIVHDMAVYSSSTGSNPDDFRYHSRNKMEPSWRCSTGKIVPKLATQVSKKRQSWSALPVWAKKSQLCCFLQNLCRTLCRLFLLRVSKGLSLETHGPHWIMPCRNSQGSSIGDKHGTPQLLVVMHSFW